jgi:hypothetical protein
MTWRSIDHEKIKMMNLKQERHQMEDKEDIQTSLIINQVHNKMYITFYIHQKVMVFITINNLNFAELS